jgi:hypothetical protein
MEATMKDFLSSRSAAIEKLYAHVLIETLREMGIELLQISHPETGHTFLTLVVDGGNGPDAPVEIPAVEGRFGKTGPETFGHTIEIKDWRPALRNAIITRNTLGYRMPIERV